MKVTKIYYALLRFDAGSADVTDEFSMLHLQGVIFKARVVPEHRIEIVTHEDPADSRDKGMAMRRLDVLRRIFLAESIPEQRLELHTHPENCNCYREVSGEFARRAEVRVFPRVACLSDEIGEPYLSHAEVDTLISAMRCVIFREGDNAVIEDNVECEELDRQHSRAEWRRMVGHDSLWEWGQAGASHPLWDRDMVDRLRWLNTRPQESSTAPCPYCGKPLRTSLAKQCRYCRKDWHAPGNVVRLGAGRYSIFKVWLKKWVNNFRRG